MLRGWFESGFMSARDLVWVEGEYGRSPAWAYPEIVGEKAEQELKVLKANSRPEPVNEMQRGARAAMLRGASWMSIAFVLHLCTSETDYHLVAIGPAIFGVALFAKGLITFLRKR